MWQKLYILDTKQLANILLSATDFGICIYCIFLNNSSRLFITLHFLKNAPTEDLGAATFKMTRNTYRKYLWSTLMYLNLVMEEIHIENRFFPFIPQEGHMFENVAIIVDGTECPIDRYDFLILYCL